MTQSDATLLSQWAAARIRIAIYYEIFSEWSAFSGTSANALSNAAHAVLSIQEDKMALARSIYRQAERFFLVHHAPLMEEIPDSRVRTVAQGGRVSVLYQGQINRRTSAEALIHFASFAPSRYHLHMAGPVEPEYTHAIDRLHHEGKLTYHGFLRSADLADLRGQCQIGLITWKSDPDVPLSIKYTTPTKLYEYIACGMPVIFMPNYSVLKLNEELHFGRMVWDHSWDALLEGLESLTADARAFTDLSRHNIELFRKHLHFAKQAQPFVDWLEARVSRGATRST
jgi:glycosyltransferase involved in cell wall biosynthesis